MDFDKELYPEKMRDRLEKAVKNSAEKHINAKLNEEESKCGECGHDELKPVIKKQGNKYNEKVQCKNCGKRRQINVELKNLSSFEHF